MKNTKKLALIASAAVLSLGFSMAGVVSANATEGQTATGTDYFVFHDGAAVRLVDDNVGEAIRFQATIGKDYYDGLAVDYADETVTLKSKVSDANNAERYLTASWELYGENAIDMTFKAGKEADFYHTIQFEQLFQAENAENIKEACALDLKAEMWIEVTGGETTVTLNGVDANKEYTVTEVTRSAREIANEAYDTYADEASDKYDTTKAARVAKYFGTRTEVSDVYFEAGETLNVVFSKEVDEKFDVTTAEVYGYKDTVAGELPTATTFAETLGSTAAVSFTMFDANNNVINVNAENAMYVTKALKTEADLAVFDIADDDDDYTTMAAKVITGYYVLANNIENETSVGANQHTGLEYNKAIGVTGSRPNYNTSTTTGFAGTFDGRGYTMALDVYQAGLFGFLQPGAAIKNVGMDVTFTNTAGTMSAVFAVQAPRSNNAANHVTLTDVYVNIDDFRSSLNSSHTGLFGYADKAYIDMSRVLVNITGAVLNEDTIASGAIFMQDTNKGTNSARFSNVFVISNTPMWMSMSEYTGVAREVRVASVTDVNGHTNAADDDPNNNGTLIYNMGSDAEDWAYLAGTLLAERNADVAQGNIYTYANGVKRYDSLETMSEKNNDATFSGFVSENGWDMSSGVLVWKTFNK